MTLLEEADGDRRYNGEPKVKLMSNLTPEYATYGPQMSRLEQSPEINSNRSRSSANSFPMHFLCISASYSILV